MLKLSKTTFLAVMKVGEKLKNTILDVAQNFDKMSDSEKAEVNDNVRKQFDNIIHGKPPKTEREKEIDKLAREELEGYRRKKKTFYDNPIHWNNNKRRRHSIEEVRSKVKDVLFEKDKKLAKVDFDGDLIKGNSQRYQTFFTKGCKCVVCGIEGKYFAKERHLQDKSYHLNLYAVDNNGDEILMTKDHIMPRSKGGIDDISNYQTMCKLCNEAKGNKLED